MTLRHTRPAAGGLSSPHHTNGRVGGFAQLATLVKPLKASRPGALLLDGGDTWQGADIAFSPGFRWGSSLLPGEVITRDYQQGGDMVRVGGLSYTCDPNAKMGGRISDLVLKGKPLEAGKKYRVAGWAPVSEDARRAGGEPIWDLMAKYLLDRKVVKPLKLNLPRLKGVAGNPGIAQ